MTPTETFSVQHFRDALSILITSAPLAPTPAPSIGAALDLAGRRRHLFIPTA